MPSGSKNTPPVQVSDHTDEPESLSAEFWKHPDITHAAQQQQFGYLLKAYRELQQPIVKQSQLAKWLGLTQGQISRIERGASGSHDLAKLVSWAKVLQIPDDILWFSLTTCDETPCTPEVLQDKIESDDSKGDDVDRRQLLKTVGIGAVLLGVNYDPNPLNASLPSASRSIGLSDINSLRYWTNTFRQADNMYGGGESLDQASHFVGKRLIPMLRDTRSTARVRKELLSSAAQLYQLVGWMSYDVGDKKTGRNCLRQAYRLCDEADNKAFSAEMLAGMSHQAAFLRSSEEAIDLALSARQIAVQTDQPALVAEAAVMEAHGLALQGDAKASVDALRRAEDQFARIRTQNMPEWLAYFDQAYLSAKFGHVLRDLGRPQDAEVFARQSLQMTEGYERGRVFNLALLAGILADKGELDESLSVTYQALQLAEHVRSNRVTGYLTDVAHRLGRFEQDARVRTLYKTMTTKQIPLMRI